MDQKLLFDLSDHRPYTICLIVRTVERRSFRGFTPIDCCRLCDRRRTVLVGVIYMPITVIGALIGTFSKKNKVSNDGQNSPPTSVPAESAPLKPNEPLPPMLPSLPIKATSQNVLSQSTVSSIRCSECFEKFSVTENACPNCNANRNFK